MAKVKIKGMEAIIKAFMSQEAGIEEKVERMLETSGQIMVKAQCDMIGYYFLIDTGAMFNSVKPTKIKKDRNNAYIRVFPQGKDKKGTRNAEKAFIKEYGTSKTPATRWMTSAIESATDQIAENNLKIFIEETNDGSG